MPSYICPRCLYEFDRISNYKRHLKSKLCQPINGNVCLENEKNKLFIQKEIKYTCDNCKKGFSIKQGLQRHLEKHCKKEKVEEKSINTEEIEKVIEISTEIGKNNDLLTNFETIKYDFIPRDKLIDLTEKNHQGIIDLVKLIYINPEHLENKSYFIKNKKKKLGMIYTKNEWQSINTDTLINNMVCHAVSILKIYSLQNPNIEEYYKEELYLRFSKIGKHDMSRIRNSIFQLIAS